MNAGDWEITEGVIDGANGLKNQYSWKGHPAIRHTLSSYTARHLAGYYLLERDIRNIRTWISAILRILDETGVPSDNFKKTVKRSGDPDKNDMVKGLFVGVLAIYGKLFATAKGRRVSLNAKIITDPKHLDHHEALIELRHSFAAHSGEESHEKCEIVVAIAPTREHLISQMFTELSQPNHFSRQVYREIDELMAFLHDHVLKKRQELWKRVKERDLGDGEMKCLVELYGKSGVLSAYICDSQKSKLGKGFRL